MAFPGISTAGGGISDVNKSDASLQSAFNQSFGGSGSVNFAPKKNPVNTAIMVGGVVIGLIVLAQIIKR